ncbi:HNH endonuclease [Corynebacterium auriscanis]|uniref:HNH endonuclease n=1 Tax=Corynebacterium auriscanis TaxID=99807 RepID=UPI0024AD0E96|nr:HNH endonuclease signature motif containing protein [Corynebacterium auriscanis]
MTRWGGRKIGALRSQVLAAHGTVCHLCGMPGATSIDHIIPRAAGGDDSLSNLRPAHTSCNSARGAQPLAQWRSNHPLPDRAPPSRDW